MAIEELFFELLQVSVGSRDSFSCAPSEEEWRMLMDMAKKQALTGLCKAALEKLPETQWPPKRIVFEWTAASRLIESRNHEVNEAAVAVSKWFAKKGFRSCILKGQGNALMYTNPLTRTPGDIDIWIGGSDNAIIGFARDIGIKGAAYYHHIEWNAYRDVEVEVHYRPSFMFNPVHNRRLQAWFRQFSDKQFSNIVDLPDGVGQIAVPDFMFNAVFQLTHLSNHFFHEGIGLRQFADYYFLLMSNKDIVADKKFRDELGDKLSSFGLYTFAGAVMWVLEKVFLLDRKYMLAVPDMIHGKLLMTEILEGGNFGKYDQRVLSGAQRTPLRHNIARIYRDLRLCCYFSSECLCEPLFRLWHAGWRLVH